MSRIELEAGESQKNYWKFKRTDLDNGHPVQGNWKTKSDTKVDKM